MKKTTHINTVTRSIFCSLLSALIVLVCIQGCSRETKGKVGLWLQLNPNPSVCGPASGGSFDVLDVQVVDSNCIVAVGTQGMFLRSTNFGNTWMSAKTIRYGTMRAVHFLDRDTGYAAGDTDKIFRTTNGGVTWENTLEFPTDPAHEPGGTMWYINDLYFTDENNGVAVGKGPDLAGLVFWTNDGAQTWNWNYSGKILNAIDFANADLGIAVGGRFNDPSPGFAGVRTTQGITGQPNTRDAGSPQQVGWDQLVPNIQTSLGTQVGCFTGISFLDDTTAYVTGLVDGHGVGVFATLDAGESWVSTPITRGSVFNCYWFYDLSYPVSTDGTVVGSNGIILRNSNAPSDWALQSSNTRVPLTCVDFISPDRGAIGGYGSTILTTKNGGDSWEGPRSVTVKDLLGIEVLDNGFVAVCGHGGTIAVSLDGGDTWSPQYRGGAWQLHDIAYASPTSGIAVGLHGYVVYTDNGQQWKAPELYPFDTRPSEAELNMNGVDFFTGAKAVAVGKERLAITEDGGRTWTERSLPENTHLVDVACLDSNRAVAVGRRGVVLRTENGGQTWNTVQIPVTDHLCGVYFQDLQYGWAVGYGPCSYLNGSEIPGPAGGDKGTILHTKDGGLTWAEQISGTEIGLSDVHFSDRDTGIAVGGQGSTQYEIGYGPAIKGVILVTLDGGDTWSVSDLPRQENLQGVWSLPSGRVYVAGSHGFIARTEILSELY